MYELDGRLSYREKPSWLEAEHLTILTILTQHEQYSQSSQRTTRLDPTHAPIFLLTRRVLGRRVGLEHISIVQNNT